MDLTVPLCFYPLNIKYCHGVALLSALLKQRGIGVELLMLGERADFTRRSEALRDPFVCFSAVTGADYEKSLPYMQAAHEMGKRVLLGGTWAGLGRPVPPYVHAVCRGDGEMLPAFFETGDDRLFRELMVFSGSLNDLPLPDYDLFSDIPFDRGLPETEGKKCLPYFSSRGCPYRCTFCQVRQQSPGYRIRTKVEEDLRYLSERYRPDWFFIGDAQMPYSSPKWRASWGEFRYPFAGYIRADIESDNLEWLIDRGMVGCALGVESGDEGYRNQTLRKDLTDAQLWKTVETLRRRGLWYVPFFMTGSPGETFLERTRTVEMARAIGKYSIIWQYEELHHGA